MRRKITLDTTAVAQLLGCSVGVVGAMCRRGEFPSVAPYRQPLRDGKPQHGRHGPAYRIPLHEAEAIAEKRTAEKARIEAERKLRFVREQNKLIQEAAVPPETATTRITALETKLDEVIRLLEEVTK